MSTTKTYEFQHTIDAIGRLGWRHLSADECVDVAWAYYFFSVQFRENLIVARQLHPADDKLLDLEQGECDTDNLSPWPGVAAPGERMNHDDFMQRSLALAPIPDDKRQFFEMLGNRYLRMVRTVDQPVRAMSIASYEDGGLEAVFNAMLTMPEWDSPVLRAFRHFLSEHIRFDSDPDAGHGALARHLQPDDRIAPLWEGFQDLLVAFVPNLEQRAEQPLGKPGFLAAAE